MDDTLPKSDIPADGAAKDVPPALQPHLLERVVQGAHETIDRLAERAAPHAQRVEEGVARANELLHERADEARELSQEWVDSLRNTVREHPLAALAAAVAAGMLIARLMRSDH